MRDTIDMAREAGLIVNSPYLMPHDHALQGIKSFEALVRADERDRAMRENAYVLAEREACAKVCEDDAWRCKKIAVETQDEKANAAALEAYLCVAAIRARGETK